MLMEKKTSKSFLQSLITGGIKYITIGILLVEILQRGREKMVPSDKWYKII